MHRDVGRRDKDVPPQSDRALMLACALVFAVAAAITIVDCAAMASMRSVAMPGGWTLSMTWMRMPGQSWIGASTTFVGMWIAMMVAMMMPVLVPMLMRHRAASGDVAGRGAATAIVGAGYFLVWFVLGIVVFAVGTAFAAIAMRTPEIARQVPLMSGCVLAVAGLQQLGAAKARHLACCRIGPNASMSRTDAGAALGQGITLGLRCVRCCAAPTVALIVFGVMDPIAMAVVTLAIAAERLAPRGERIARVSGIVALAVGGAMIVRAAGFA